MAGPIRISILANASQARKEFSSTANDAEGMGSKITGIGKKVGLAAGAGLALAGAAAVKFGAAATKSASDAQQSLGATETVFGKFAKGVIDNSNKAAKSVGLSANEYRELANVMGASLSGAGIPLKETARLTDDINKRAADMAATFGGTTKNAVEAIGSLMRGEADPIEQFGVSIKQSDVNARLAAKGLDGLTGSALKQAEMQARLDLLMQKTAKTQGAFKRESNTLAHQQQVLGAQFENIKAKIGTALLPVLTNLLTMLNNNIGPAFRAVGNFITPVVAKVKEFFDGASGGASVLRPLQTMFQTIGTTLTGVVVPAISSVVAYFAGKLLPIITQVVGVITGKVLPIFTSFTTFIYGTLVPAVVAIAAKIASNLKPILDQLFSTISSRVLPAVTNLLTKFREWQPTIQRVIEVVVKVIGKVLEFAAAILGKVLPPVIRFAGFLTGTLLSAVGGAIGVIVKIIAKVIEFGTAVVDGARKVGDFASKVKDKIDDVVTWFTNLPGKITGALDGAKTLLVQIGKNIVQGLVDGLNAAKQWVIDKIKEIADIIPGWIAKRLGIASPSKVTMYLGEMAGQGLADGIENMRGAVAKSTDKLAEQVSERLKKKIEKAKGVRDSITSLAGQIGGSLTGDLFGARGDEEGTALDKFRSGLAAAKATALQVRDAVKSLMGAGVSGSFLQSLVGSGNSELVVQLAGAGDAGALAKEYEAMLAVNAETGLAVAEEVIGTRLDTVNGTIQRLSDKLDARDERDREEKKKPVQVRFTAEQISRLERGREIRADLDAWDNSGGRRRA